MTWVGRRPAKAFFRNQPKGHVKIAVEAKIALDN
jgi:hypothetical protein